MGTAIDGRACILCICVPSILRDYICGKSHIGLSYDRSHDYIAGAEYGGVLVLDACDHV